LAAILLTLVLTACGAAGSGTASPLATSEGVAASTPVEPSTTASPMPSATGGDSSGITTTDISDEMTQTITVWQPAGEGPFPVVYALHGHEGSRRELSVIAEALARDGALVFAADYRSTEELDVVIQDVECGYRYSLTIAEQFGGSLDLPITMIGHSQGASAVLVHGLRETDFGPGGTFEACFTAAPRPDVIAPIAGCHYGLGDVTWDFDTSGFGNEDADIVLVAGTSDDTCPASQSENAAAALRALAYQVELVEIEGADHATIISQDEIQGELVLNPAGTALVEAIRTAIVAAEE
jgi:acetyl esterase/lipase